MGTETATVDLYVRNDDSSWSPLPTKIAEFESFEMISGECKQDG